MHNNTKNIDYIQSFLTRNNWHQAQQLPLIADASNRRYIRLIQKKQHYILMNAMLNTETSNRNFVLMTKILHNYDYSVPRIFANNKNCSLLLIEDFGDNLFKQVCENNSYLQTELYQTAVDLLVDLQQKPYSIISIAPYDLNTYLDEADLLIQWYIPAIAKTTIMPTIAKHYRQLLTRLCTTLNDKPPCLVLRDYHAENLMWLPKRNGIKRVGLLDYQDARIGHCAYDLVSLLQDARRTIKPEFEISMIHRYLNATGYDYNSFRTAYNILGAQRNLKIIGIFSRLSLRDNKYRYSLLIKRVYNYLQHNLTDPMLRDLKNWLDKHMPPPTVKNLKCLQK